MLATEAVERCSARSLERRRTREGPEDDRPRLRARSARTSRPRATATRPRAASARPRSCSPIPACTRSSPSRLPRAALGFGAPGSARDREHVTRGDRDRDPSRGADRPGVLHRPRRRRRDRRDGRDRRPRDAVPGRDARRHGLRRAASATRPSRTTSRSAPAPSCSARSRSATAPRSAPTRVVIHDVPPNSTVVGNPGHPVRVDGRRPEGPDTDWIHLPDPVADALKALSEPDRRARAQVAELTGSEQPEPADGAAAAPRQGPEPRGRLDSDAGRATAQRSRRERGRRRRRAARAAERLLEGLNPPQREAVTARRRAAARAGRRGLRQDARAHPPDRAPGRHRAGAGRPRSSRSPSPTRRPRRCASASRRSSAAWCG